VSRDPDSFDRNNLPSWLRNQQLPPNPDQAEPETGDDAIPDWLREVSSGPAPAPAAAPAPLPPADELPDWLQPRADEASANDDWLGGFTSQADAAEQTPALPPPNDAEALPDWLREIATQEQAQLPPPDEGTDRASDQPQPAPPAWLNDDPPPEVQPFSLDVEGGVAPFSLPPEARGGSVPPSEEVPRWLRDAAPSDANDTTNAVPDWLYDQPDAATLSGPANDAPDWLRDITSPADGEAASPAAPAWLHDQPQAGDVNRSEDDAPDWLRDIASAPDDEHEAASPAGPAWLHNSTPAEQAEAAPAATPDWLRDIEPPPDAPQPAAAPVVPHEPLAAPQPADDALPAWLRDVPEEAPRADTLPPWMHQPTPEATELEATEPVATGDATLPDWLRDLPADNADQPPPEVPEVAARGDDVPAWLREEPPTLAPPPAPVAPTLPPAPDEAGLPNWLRGAANDEPAPAEPGLPAWLRDAPTDLPAPLPREQTPLATSSTAMSASGADTLPPWINAREEQAASSGNEMLRGTDLPAWLLVERSTTTQEDAEDTRALGWLARLRTTDEEADSLPLRATTDAARPQVVQRQVPPEALALLQQLSAEPFAQPTAPNVRPTTRPPIVGVERLMMAALLLCVLLGVLAPNLAAPFAPIGVAPSPSIQQLYQTIDALDERSVVLLAYEWDSRRGSELAPLERGITDHLIARQAGIVTLSTDPQGTLLSLDLQDRLRAAGYERGGVDDLFLGYLPGGDLALRRLAQNFGASVRRDFAGRDTSDSVFVTGQLKGRPALDTLDQVALIVVLADETQDVQGWVEQVHSRAPQVPMALVVPAEAGPVLQPYLTSNRLMPLIGQDDALAYGAQLTQIAPAAGQQLAQLIGARNLGLLAFVLLALGGGLVVLLKRTT
jgi:hypothetical protein